MGFTTRCGFRRSLPPEIADRAYGRLRPGHPAGDPPPLPLGRSPEVLDRHGERLGELRCPALVLWPSRRPVHRRGLRPPLRRRTRRRRDARDGRRRPLALARRGRRSVDRVAAFLRLARVLASRRAPRRSRLRHGAAEAAHRSRRRPAPASPSATSARGCAGSTGGTSRPVAIAVVFAIVYLIWQPRTVDLAAHTFRADLFGRGGLHDLERPVVRRPPHAGLLDHLAAAGLAARAAGGAGAGRGRLGGAVRAAGTRRLRRGARRAGARSGSASAPPRCCSRPGCRSRSAWPSASPRCSRCSAAATSGRSSSRRSARSAARWPACSWRWPAWPSRSPPSGDRTKRLEGLAIAVAAFIPPLFLAWAFPEGGWAPFPFTAYLPIPLFTLACLAGAAARAARAALGRGAVRAGRHASRC